ncbi:hypothetical protein EI94DRAFT_1705264 [Lactarius quietus]|nr:hypothetical protein EI94DRAFT_1705264 [Lactarius quietus]
MAKQPSLKAISFDDLACKYGAIDFQDTLADFITQTNHPTTSGAALSQLATDMLIPFHLVPVHHKIKFSNSDDSEIIHSIQIWLEHKDVHGRPMAVHFDMALIHRKAQDSSMHGINAAKRDRAAEESCQVLEDTRRCFPKTQYEEVLDWRHSLVIANERMERQLDFRDKTQVLQEGQAAKYIIWQHTYNGTEAYQSAPSSPSGLGMPRSSLDWGLDPDHTKPHLRSSQVWGAVHKFSRSYSIVVAVPTMPSPAVAITDHCRHPPLPQPSPLQQSSSSEPSSMQLFLSSLRWSSHPRHPVITRSVGIEPLSQAISCCPF